MLQIRCVEFIDLYNNEKKYGLKYAILFDVLIPRSVHELVVL